MAASVGQAEQCMLIPQGIRVWCMCSVKLLPLTSPGCSTCVYPAVAGFAMQDAAVFMPQSISRSSPWWITVQWGKEGDCKPLKSDGRVSMSAKAARGINAYAAGDRSVTPVQRGAPVPHCTPGRSTWFSRRRRLLCPMPMSLCPRLPLWAAWKQPQLSRTSRVSIPRKTGW